MTTTQPTVAGDLRPGDRIPLGEAHRLADLRHREAERTDVRIRWNAPRPDDLPAVVYLDPSTPLEVATAPRSMDVIVDDVAPPLPAGTLDDAPNGHHDDEAEPIVDDDLLGLTAVPTYSPGLATIPPSMTPAADADWVAHAKAAAQARGNPLADDAPARPTGYRFIVTSEDDGFAWRLVGPSGRILALSLDRFDDLDDAHDAAAIHAAALADRPATVIAP